MLVTPWTLRWLWIVNDPALREGTRIPYRPVAKTTLPP